jgi:hypothetical protein
LKWNLGCKLVVLADEQHREPPDACHVQPFVKRAVVHRAIAEERDRHAVGLEQLEAVARARRLKNARTDNTAGAHQTNLGCEQVHAPAAAAGATGLASEKLGDKFNRCQSFGQRVAMPTVRTENHVLPTQVRTDTDGDSLLPDIRVARAMDKPTLMTARQLLLRLADELHRTVEVK